MVLVGATLKLVVAVVTRAVSEASLLLGELFKSLHGESSSLVVNRLSVVCLVNGNSGVDNVRLDSVLLNNRLNVLVDVVMHSLASNGRSSGGSMSRLVSRSSVLELRMFPVKGILGLPLVSVVESLVCDGDDVVVVLLRAGRRIS